MSRRNWSCDEITLALALYLRTPYSKIHDNNPEICQLAQYIGRSNGAVTMKLANLAYCDPQVRARNLKGFSNGSKLDREVWNQYCPETGTRTNELLQAIRTLAPHFSIPLDFLIESSDDPETPLIEDPTVSEALKIPTVREVVRKERQGQSLFRSWVLSAYENRCAVSGIGGDQPRLVEAAHIVPWSENEALRLEPTNGIALNVFIHRAFDLSLLGITPDFKVEVSRDFLEKTSEENRTFFSAINGATLSMPSRFRPNQDFLAERYRNFQDSIS